MIYAKCRTIYNVYRIKVVTRHDDQSWMKIRKTTENYSIYIYKCPGKRLFKHVHLFELFISFALLQDIGRHTDTQKQVSLYKGKIDVNCATY